MRRACLALATGLVLLVGCAAAPAGSSPVVPPSAASSPSASPSPTTRPAMTLDSSQEWIYTDGGGRAFTVTLAMSAMVPFADAGPHPDHGAGTPGRACTADPATSGIIAAHLVVTADDATGDLHPALLLKSTVPARYPYTFGVEVPYASGAECKKFGEYWSAGLTLAWNAPLAVGGSKTTPVWIVVDNAYPDPDAAQLDKAVFRMTSVSTNDGVTLTPTTAGLTLGGRAT